MDRRGFLHANRGAMGWCAFAGTAMTEGPHPAPPPVGSGEGVSQVPGDDARRNTARRHAPPRQRCDETSAGDHLHCAASAGA